MVYEVNNNNLLNRTEEKSLNAGSKKPKFNELKCYAALNNIDLSKYGINESLSEEVCAKVLELFKTGNVDTNKIFSLTGNEVDENGFIKNKEISNNKKAKVEALCKEFEIDFTAIKEEYYDNLLKSAEYVKNEIAKGIFKPKNNKEIGRQVLQYTTALNYDWDNINEYKKYAKKDSDSFIDRLIKAKCLKKKEDMAEYTEDELTRACEKYFVGLFKVLGDKKRKEKKMTAEQTTAWVNKLFNQTYGKLLINTTDESERNLIVPIIASLKDGMIDKAINNMMLLTSHDEKLRSATAQKMLVNDKILDKAKSSTIRETSRYLDYEDAQKTQEYSFSRAISYYRENSDIIYSAEQKYLDGEQLTPEESEIYYEYRRLTSNHAPIKAGIADSNVLPKEQRFAVVADAENKLRKLCEKVYRDDQIATKKYIETEIPEEEREKYINFFEKTSNGNFSKINNDYKAELNPPADVKALSEGSQADLGYKNNTPKDYMSTAQTKAAAFLAQMAAQTKSQEFNVESVDINKKTKNSSSGERKPSDKLKGFSGLSLMEMISNENIKKLIEANRVKLKDAIKNFADLTKSNQQTIEQHYIKPHSDDDKLALIDTIDSNTEKAKLSIKYHLDGDKLHLDTNARKRLELENDTQNNDLT